MAKIKVHSLLQNKTDREEYPIDTFGILKDNEIQFLEEDTKVFITFEEPEIQMKRIRDTDILYLNFHPTLTREGIYDIKSVSMELHLKTKTKKMKRMESGFEIFYQMELEGEEPKEFCYRVEYEVIS